MLVGRTEEDWRKGISEQSTITHGQGSSSDRSGQHAETLTRVCGKLNRSGTPILLLKVAVDRQIVGDECGSNIALTLDGILGQAPGVYRQRTRSGNLPEGLSCFPVDLDCRGGKRSYRLQAHVTIRRPAPQSREKCNCSQTVWLDGRHRSPCDARVRRRV